MRKEENEKGGSLHPDSEKKMKTMIRSKLTVAADKRTPETEKFQLTKEAQALEKMKGNSPSNP